MTSATATTIAIAGISSKLATRIASTLLQRNDIQLRGSCRDIAKLPLSLKDNPRLRLIQTEPYDTHALRRLVRGCDTVICCYFADNATMIAAQRLLIGLCEEEGVHRYLASDYTGDYRKLDYGDIPEKDPMKDIFAYLQGTKVKGVHVLVGLFMETFWNFLSGWSHEEKTFRFWGSGEEKWEVTTYQTAAEYVAAVAVDPEAVGFLKFLSDRRSIAEIADIMESVYGIIPKLEILGTVSECDQRRRTVGQDALATLHAQASYFLLTNKTSLGEDLDNQRYPMVRPETFRDFLRARKIEEIRDNDFAITEK